VGVLVKSGCIKSRIRQAKFSGIFIMKPEKEVTYVHSILFQSVPTGLNGRTENR
jgi:hypothetical protein